MIVYIVLDKYCLEHRTYDGPDYSMLMDWFFNYDEISDEQSETFDNWIDSLQTGLIVDVPTHDGYRIVKCVVA